MVTPTMFPWDKKASGDKKVYHKNVLIPWYPISYLTIASSIGHPPHSSASPVELRMRLGPRALSEKKELR
jgi:hypothetical protein